MIQYRSNGITIFQSALYETTSTVVETPSLVLLVDPTWLPREVEEIQSFVAHVRCGRPLYLLFTHSDWDHVLGYQAFPDAVTIGSHELAENPDKQDVVQQIRDFDSQNYLRRNYEIVYPSIDVEVCQDGQKLRVTDTVITFYKAPGHTDCGLFTIVEPQGVFFAGDYLSNIEFPYIYYSSQAYEQTLQKVDSILKGHQVHLLVPGHGQSTTELKEMLLRQQHSLSYIKTLRQYVRNNRYEDIENMLNEYEFPHGMRHYHEANQDLVKKELALTNFR